MLFAIYVFVAVANLILGGLVIMNDHKAGGRPAKLSSGDIIALLVGGLLWPIVVAFILVYSIYRLCS